MEASDKIMVTRVHVTVRDDEGSVLEKGEAMRKKGNWWEFASRAEGRTITAEAWDLPGNVTKLVLEA